MIGFSLLKPEAPSHRQKQQQQHKQHKQRSDTLSWVRRQQLHEAALVPMQSCEAEVELPGGVALLLVPYTYAPGVTGRFTVSVEAPSASGDVVLKPVPGGLTAAVAVAVGAV